MELLQSFNEICLHLHKVSQIILQMISWLHINLIPFLNNPATPLLGTYPRERKQDSQSHMNITALNLMAQHCKPTKCPPPGERISKLYPQWDTSSDAKEQTADTPKAWWIWNTCRTKGARQYECLLQTCENRQSGCGVTEVRPMVSWGEGTGIDWKGERGNPQGDGKVLYFYLIWVILVYVLIKTYYNTSCSYIMPQKCI